MRKFFGFAKRKKKSASQEDTKEKKREQCAKAEVSDVTKAGKTNGLTTLLGDDKRRQNVRNSVEETPRYGNVPRQNEGEQIAAGWPAWLTAVAGEALRGWLPRRADSFEKIDKIGQGTYSNVYKARDLETGKVVALKKVRFDNLEPESVRFMAREIKVLRRLNHPNVVKLEGLVTSRMSCSLYLVFEYMDHDLAGITASPNVTFTEPQVKCYMLQILRGLDHCHSCNVLHRDIKGSNLLLDKEGNLKIADFGLATFFNPHKQQQLTTRVVTLWYRPPELLLGATEYGIAIDLWSVGCILGELFAGRPILPGRTEVEQLHKIFKLCGSPSDEYWKKYKLSHATIFKPQQPYKRSLMETYKNFPQTALSLMDVLLAIEPDARSSASSALRSEFFTTKPFACDPSSLPKYVPNKGGGRDSKARRQRDADSKTSKKEEISSKLSAVQLENAEKTMSNEKNFVNGQASSRCRSERFTAPKQIVSKLHADGVPHYGGGRNYTFALPLKPSQPDTQANLNWAGIWGKNTRAEETYLVKAQGTSRSVRYANITDVQAHPDSTSHLSNLSTTIATEKTSQELPADAPETSHNERAHGKSHKQPNMTTSAQSHSIRRVRLDSIDVQDAVLDERSKNKNFGAPPARIQLSGPLLPPSANVDRILDERERQIQEVVRRARQERGRNQHKAYVSDVRAIGTKVANNNTKAFQSWDKHGGLSSKTKKGPEDLDSLFKNYESEYEMRHL